ncbi:type 4a pilus biogenesis protein PilO [Microbacterium jejuense]|uniref:Type 4a pilus biogenesis protein PilO n=1 Tax=Microbacterium jejuense TaxID=1263637 RepID=A0ABS7HPA9_9MICO|nr:type 4a pilus biogenesis protein PilO [Microbacterium jejuense]MBW9094076.1 type 4a pilus biogenesis protein PilO [Microbacterium jejuense]
MPKHLVTAIGLIVSLGVIALGVFLVALPLYFQAVGVDAQTATVANTNTIYQAQVDSLTEQQQNLDQINADVAQLRAQIPADGQLDDVFEVVGRAAEDTGVQLTAVTAGEQVAFVARTGVEDPDAAATPAPEPTPAATDAAADTTATGDAATPAPPTATDSRQQVDFTISATAGDMAQATAFLDALRAGPRLLSSITATSTQSGEGTVALQITALTYVDGVSSSEGGR